MIAAQGDIRERPLPERTETAVPKGRRTGERMRFQQALWLSQWLLYLVLAFLLARLVWAIFAPLPVPEAAPTIPSGRVQTDTNTQTPIVAKNPFAVRGATSAPVDLPQTDYLTETTLNLTLHGIRLQSDGGTAIIDVVTSDNIVRGQDVFSVGDTILEGVELVELREGEAIISREGVREILRMPNTENPTSTSVIKRPRPRTSVSVNSQQVVSPQTLSENNADTSINASAGQVSRRGALQTFVNVRRRKLENGTDAMLLYPGSNREAFAEAGLLAADILLSVNGTPPPNDLRRLYQLMERFSGSGTFSLVVERQGTPRTITIALDELIELRRDNDSDDDDDNFDDTKL